MRKTYKNINTLKNQALYETWINFIIILHPFVDFASTRISPKTCPALSWDQALLLVSWENRFQAGKVNWKVAHLVQFLCTWITYACESNV